MRAGRLTASQNRALSDLYHKFGLKLADGIQDLTSLFNRNAPTVLEIGFGNGDNLLKLAQNHPEINFIGIEVHSPGVGTLLLAIERLNLTNIRIYQADAVEVLTNCIADDSLSQVLLFFPDPWPKKKHHKRRIVQPSFVQLVNAKLQRGGKFYLATDWQEYAEHMLAVLSSDNNFTNTAADFAQRPDFRVLTKFENRGLQLGYKVFDLLFTKNKI